MAEQERENIRKRQAQGIVAAKARGIKFGRPEIKIPPIFHAVVMDWSRRKITGTQAAKKCGMPLSTFRLKAIPLKEKFLAALEMKGDG